MEQDIYAQVFKICQKHLKITQANKDKMRVNSSSKVRLQDHSIGLVLVLFELKNILAHVNLTSIGKYFKGMTIQKIQIHLKYLKFQSEIQNV